MCVDGSVQTQECVEGIELELLEPLTFSADRWGSSSASIMKPLTFEDHVSGGRSRRARITALIHQHSAATFHFQSDYYGLAGAAHSNSADLTSAQ